MVSTSETTGMAEAQAPTDASRSRPANGGLSPLARLGTLALVVTPLAVLPYLMARRHMSSLRRELGALRSNQSILERELRLHEDRSALQVKRIHSSYRTVAEELESLRREGYARAGKLEAKLEALRSISVQTSGDSGKQYVSEDSESAPTSTHNDEISQRLVRVEEDLSIFQGSIEARLAELQKQSPVDEVMARLDALEPRLMEVQDAMTHQSDRDIASQQTERVVSNILDQVAELRLEMSDASKRVSDLDSKLDARLADVNERVNGLVDRTGDDLVAYNKKQKDIEDSIVELHGTARAIGAAIEQMEALRREKPSAQEMQTLGLRLQDQHLELKKARDMQVAAFEVLRLSLGDLASFIEGTEPFVGMKYDNGQANRLRRLANYLRDCQAQLDANSNNHNV